MIQKQSVTGRAVVGKLIGLTVGLFCVALLPIFGFPLTSMFGLGTVLMFMVMGVMIAFVGQFDRHPLFDFKMNWAVRGAAVGFGIMLMYILLGYDNINVVMESSVISWLGLESPFWALLDGIVIGMIMGYAETKIAGDGPDLPLQ